MNKRLVLIIAAAALTACDPNSYAAPTNTTSSTVVVTTTSTPTELIPPANLERATVSRVIDGDTIVISTGEKVRLIGIDTPESAQGQKKECYGPESTAYIKSILPPSTPIVLEDDKDLTDRYGRRLAYIYRTSDNLFVNAELVKAGYAEVLTIKPNVAHKATFESLQADAQKAGRGLWSACPNP